MNRVSNENNIPFRCVTQWATHQTGKLYDTLGVKLESQTSDELSLEALGDQSVAPPVLKPALVRKRAVRGKKSDVK